MVYTCTSCHTSRRIPAPPILNEDTDILMDDVPGHASTSQISKLPDSVAVVAMDVTTEQDACPGVEDLKSSGRRGKLRKTVVSRRPPLFARDGGHVVFCGNERLYSTGVERDNGIYIV